MRTLPGLTLCVLLVVAAGSATAFAGLVYDNTTTIQNSYYATTAEYGDEITLAGTDRQVDAFTVILYGPSPTTIDLGLAFYQNDNTGGAPGTLIQSYGPISVDVSGLTSVPLTLGTPVTVPDTFTWTITTSDASAGAVMYDPPTVGSSDDFFWEVDGGVWNSYYFIGGPVANFGASVDAVPEPATLALMALGGLMLFGRRRRSR